MKTVLGVEKVPDQSALGEWLRAVGEPGWEALRQTTREFVAWTLARVKLERLLVDGWLECFFDDAQMEMSGKWLEGAAIDYEGHSALSWQTSWVGAVVGQRRVGGYQRARKECLTSDVAGRGVSGPLPGWLAANRSLWQAFSSYLYADSASSAGRYLAAIAESFDGWSVSYNQLTGLLEARAVGTEFNETPLS